MSRPASGPPRRPRVLILVENLAVPFDRRVWQEAQALRDAGYDVSVICPTSAQHPRWSEVLDGVHIHRYPSPFEARRTLGYLIEYPVALVSQLLLALKVARRGRIDLIHACNPPDLLFLVAWPFRRFGGTRFLFDHHDASPELLMAKGRPADGPVVRFARLLERRTFRMADVSIATNESYRRIAVERGGMDPDDVFVVRSAPDVGRFAAARVDPGLRRGRTHLVAYVGVMGIQEGLDYLIDAVDDLVHRRGRTDVQFVLAGGGPEFRALSARVDRMGLAPFIDMPGRVTEQQLADLLATADLCVNPDEWNEMNDISTMNKVMEYMALGKPMVQFDLREGRVSAGDASLYARPNDAAALADGILELLDDPDRRTRMGSVGRERFLDRLSWEHSVPPLLAAYRRALPGGDPVAEGSGRPELGTRRLFGFDLIDSDDLAPVVERVLAGPPDGGGLPLVVTPNVDHLVKLRGPSAAAFRSTIEQSFTVLPDGQPLVWTSSLAGRPLAGRLAGSDLFSLLWERLVDEGRPTLVIAPTQQVADGLAREFPSARYLVAPRLDRIGTDGLARFADECARVIRTDSVEQVVVGIGFPGQLVLATAVLDRMAGERVPVMSLLGGSLEMHLGLTRRAPEWMRSSGLEWVHRLRLEPRRLWRRYLVDSVAFLPILLTEVRSARREDGRRRRTGGAARAGSRPGAGSVVPAPGAAAGAIDAAEANEVPAVTAEGSR